jgi:hypothetical protein
MVSVDVSASTKVPESVLEVYPSDAEECVLHSSLTNIFSSPYSLCSLHNLVSR